MRGFVLAFCLLVFGAAQAQEGSSPARELTVRLFSTASAKSLSVASTSASMRLCEACKQTPVPAGLTVQMSAGHLATLLVGTTVAREVWFDGELQATVNDGRSARGAGTWLVRPAVDGLHVTLVMLSERYVMSVLQSEAGTDDGPEALKALAVVARSFALANPHRHGAEGLCDSTHCQAARMAPVPERIRDAVLATAGETLSFGGRRVDGYFTQNCGGSSADAAEVWGGLQKPWLRAHGDPYCQRQPSQWHASVPQAELLRSLHEQGFHAPTTIDEFRIKAKDSSGRASRIEISGRGQRLALSASALRFAVNREMGWGRLRSDWYVAHKEHGSIIFDGRGYGHGVGLCQAGAAEMARQRKSYREILAFYFSGAEVRVNAQDSGWRTEPENGWTLRSMGVDRDVVRSGNIAWRTAVSKWGAATGARPVVTVAPDTELFRQIANEPGWALAATRGDRVTLQPAAVMKAQGGYDRLLLHEFLHVLVESEANSSCPLWLREGLVETLAGENTIAATVAPAQIEGALRDAHSFRESQQAHHWAAALVSKLVAKYGLGSVRGWLRSGVPAGVFASQQS